MNAKTDQKDIFYGVLELEAGKIKLEKQIAAITLAQGHAINDIIPFLKKLPRINDEIEVDLGSRLLNGKYRVISHGFNIKSDPELKGGKFTGNFGITITIQAFGLKLKTRNTIGEKTRVVVEKVFTEKVKRDAIFGPNENPDEILRYRK